MLNGGDEQVSDDKDENEEDAGMGGNDSDEYAPREEALNTDKSGEAAAAPQNCEH
jgi:hypothetical protein